MAISEASNLPHSPWCVKLEIATVQASSNLQLLLQYQSTTDQLGAILLKSIGQNQSYAVAEAVRFALIPNSNFSAPDPSLMPAYQTLASNIGAATAYAMHYARQQICFGDCRAK